MRTFRSFITAQFTAVCFFAAINVSAQEVQVATNTLPPVIEPSISSSKDDRSAQNASPASIAAEALRRVGVQTADTVPLTLDEAIRRALMNNTNIEIARDDVRIQETQINALRGFYDPVFTVSPTYQRNNTTGSSATNDLNVNSSLTQQISTGGNFSTFFNNSRTENAFAQAQVSSGSLSSSGSAIYSSSYGVRFTQPLFRNFKIDNTRRNLTIAKRRLEQTDAEFRRQTIEVITQVQRAYWDLVFALRDQQNKNANLELTKENLRQVEARIAAGAAAPLAKAEVETELANREAEVIVATQQVSISENTLKQLLLKDALSTEWARTYLPTDTPAFSTDPVNLQDAVNDALANRFELRSLKLSQDINKIDIDYYKNQTKPQIDLNTSFSLNGLARSGTTDPVTTNLFTSQGELILLNGLNEARATIPGLDPILNPQIVVPGQPSYAIGGLGRSLANTFRSDAPNFSVGVTISFPFRNRTAKANLAGAQITQNRIETQMRAQEQAVMVEVRNAVQAVETARQRVLAARRARENAEIQLDGERKLFESGRSTTFLLFQRENALATARNSEIRAETDYNKALADLQRATSTTFRVNNIDVQSPTDGQ